MWMRRAAGKGADAVTLEIEQIGVDALSEVARLRRCGPASSHPHYPGQDAAKDMARRCGLSGGAVSRGASEAELHEAVRALGGRVFLKIGRGGYDGRGQARIGLDGAGDEEAIAAAWEHRRTACRCRAGAGSGLRDQRDGGAQSAGEVRSYPAARNHHENQILAWSVLPAGVPAELESRAEALAAAIIARLGMEGLLCVEMFVTRRASCW
jgi:5-(carboxyamino)imidazole ribonucleotide synthase